MPQCSWKKKLKKLSLKRKYVCSISCQIENLCHFFFALRLSFFLRFHYSLWLRFWQFCLFLSLDKDLTCYKLSLFQLLLFDNSLRIVCFLLEPIFCSCVTYNKNTWKFFFFFQITHCKKQGCESALFSVGSSIFLKVWIRIQIRIIPRLIMMHSRKKYVKSSLIIMLFITK